MMPVCEAACSVTFTSIELLLHLVVSNGNWQMCLQGPIGEGIVLFGEEQTITKRVANLG